jgi:hypothetical protein
MSHPRTERLVAPFRHAASAYLEGPAVLTGLELVEVAGQRKQAAASELQDDTLVALLHQCLKCVREGDAGRIRDLIGAVGERLGTHGLGNPTAP